MPTNGPHAGMDAIPAFRAFDKAEKINREVRRYRDRVRAAFTYDPARRVYWITEEDAMRLDLPVSRTATDR